MVGGGIVDHRTHEGCGVGEGFIDDEPVDELDDRLEQLLFLALLDDQAPCRGAALAASTDGGSK